MSDDAVRPTVERDTDQHAPHNQWRWAVWLIALVVLVGFGVLRSVTTNLGVEALNRTDKRGHDQIWGIWWRARHDIVDFGPAWGFTVIYVGLALAFIVLSALAVWIALVPDEPDDAGNSVSADPSAAS
jgi:hypothetical protein